MKLRFNKLFKNLKIVVALLLGDTIFPIYSENFYFLVQL